MSDFVYDKAKPKILDGSIDASHVWKLALLKATHTPGKSTHEFFADVSGDEASGAGYAAGGITLTDVVITRNTITAKLDAADVVIEELSADFRYVVIYDDTHASNALVCLFDWGAEVTPMGFMTVIQFNANGIITLTDG